MNQKNPEIKKIFLCGFSGAGKSYILNFWRNNQEFSSNFSLIDLDEWIFDSLNLISPEEKKNFFAVSKNIETFRKKEFECLRELCLDQKKILVSLGGGSLSQEIVDLIKSSENSLLIFINTPFEDCLKVIQSDSTRYLNRLESDEIEKIFKERLKLYKQAHLKYSISELKNIEGPQSFRHN